MWCGTSIKKKKKKKKMFAKFYTCLGYSTFYKHIPFGGDAEKANNLQGFKYPSWWPGLCWPCEH